MSQIPTRRRRTLLLGLLVASMLTATLALRVHRASDADGFAAATIADGPRSNRLATDEPGTSSTTVPATDTTTGADDPAADVDDDQFPDMPDADDEDPGPWFPHDGPDDFAPSPVVLDFVAEVDPGLSEEAEGTIDGGFAADVGCAAQCIRTATATMGGTDVEFSVHTNTAVRIWVVLDSPAVKDSGHPLRKDWKVSFDGLEPDTMYNVTLVAEHEHGRLSHRYAQIRTLQRRVTVTFTSIDVINDADKYAVNKGEIEFFFAVNGTWRPEAHQGTQKIKSGRSIHLGDEGEQIVIDDAPQQLVLLAQGIEHDKSLHFCSEGIPPYNDWAGGDAGWCIDGATASEVFDLDDLGVPNPALPSANDAYFAFETTDHYLRFRVHGSIDVTYV